MGIKKDKKTLDGLLVEKETFDPDSQAFLESLAKTREEVEAFNNMKRTDGWKIMNRKIREELGERILFLVKDDLKIQTLLALLNVASTKKREKALNEEIANLIPED